MNDFRVELDSFSGPMDLLLHLVREQEVDIRDVSISLLLKGYLAYLELIQEIDLNDATDFLVMVPLTLYPAAIQAVSVPAQSGPTQLALKAVPQEFNIKVVPNARIGTDWTASFAVFRTDSEIKSFIRQEETAVKFDVLGDGSDHTFKEDSHLYGVDAWRNVGYGYWQNACYVTMT